MIAVRCGFLSKALLAAYVLAAALLPLAHHDIICHVKSSTHCTTCLVSSSGEAAPLAAALDSGSLRDAGRTAAGGDASVHPVVVRVSSGRSPPQLG
jgi:hypothetical protein